MAVYITCTKEEAEALSAVLSGGLSLRILSDLGLSTLQGKLSVEFGDVRLRSATRLDRTYANTPAHVLNMDKDRDYYVNTD